MCDMGTFTELPARDPTRSYKHPSPIKCAAPQCASLCPNVRVFFSRACLCVQQIVESTESKSFGLLTVTTAASGEFKAVGPDTYEVRAGQALQDTQQHSTHSPAQYTQPSGSSEWSGGGLPGGTQAGCS